MRHEDRMKLTGRLLVTAEDIRTGAVVAYRHVDNLVTLVGRNLVRDLLGDATSDRLTHMAVGTGTTAAAAGDTTLGSEVHRDALTQVDVSESGKISVLLFLGSTVANGFDLTEAGVLTEEIGGKLYARAVYAAITKTASIAVTYDWEFTIGAS